MIRVYCDTGGFDPRLRPLVERGRISLHTFKYENRSRRIRAGAFPSDLRFNDTPTYTHNDLKHDGFLRHITFNEMRRALAASKFHDIVAVVGMHRRRDAQHLDSAHMTGCRAFLTSDKDDIAGANRTQLEAITGLRIFYVKDEWQAFLEFIENGG